MPGSTPRLNIVCALSGEFRKSEADISTAIEQYNIENQHGTWNKTTLKWYIKGDIDELFEERTNFMKTCFNIAFTEWDIEIPLVLIQAESEDDADIVIEFGTRENDPYYSGEKGKYVLAYAGYPNGGLKGYMKIFTHWDWEVKGSTNIITVIIHELGHLLGRPHSERRVWKDIMDPIINAAITELSSHDVAGITAAYGAREYANDQRHNMLETANRRQKERLRGIPATS